MSGSGKYRTQVICIASILCLLSFLLSVYFGYEYKSSKTDEIILEDAKENALQKAEYAIKNVHNGANSTRAFADGVAQDLSSGKLKNDSILQERILAEMKLHPNIFSIVVAYSPSTNAGKLKASRFFRNGSEIVNSALTYDYTKDSKQTAWYNDAMRTGSKIWIPPYFGIAARTYMVGYSSPFYFAEFKGGNKPAGVVNVHYSLEGLRTYLNNLKIGDTGFGFVISGEGEIISYPIPEYLTKNIHDLAKQDPTIYFINNNLTKHDYLATNFLTGQSYWVFQQNIPSTDSILGFAIPLEETLLNKKTEQIHALIPLVLAIFSFLFSLCLLFVSIYRYDHKGLWMLAVIFSLLCILGMGFMWHFTMNNSFFDSRNGDLIVFDREGVETVLQHSNTSPTTNRIPTGFLIKSMEFVNANDVLITGHIWQNISGIGIWKDVPDFSFPDSKETTFDEPYVNKEKGLLGWRFKTTLRQQLDYSKYPFDREDVWIRVVSDNTAGNILVPDFDSYKSMIPEKLPGLGRSFVLDGWDPQKTFFSYGVSSNDNSNIELENFANSNASEFHFNVGVKRKFESIFTSNFIYIIVALILLFAILAMITKGESKTHFGFSSQGVLGYCTSILFTLIIVHTSLRSKIPIVGVIYLEYFYFILYFAILVISLNSIAFASHKSIPFVDANDNLYMKVLYWPVIMGVLFFITILKFY
jgi:Cache domain